MKILIFYRLVRCIATYHFLSSLIVFLVLEVNGVSGRSDLKTKLLLQNIRTHLAQKADEIVKQKECESGFILCKNVKSKEVEGDEEKSDEIPPAPKAARGQHKPTIRVNPKDVIQTLMPKVHKSLFRKPHKFGETERHTKILHSLEDTDEDEMKDESEESTQTKDESDEVATMKDTQDIKKRITFKKPTQTEQQVKKSTDEKPAKVVKANEEDVKKVSKKSAAEMPKDTTKSEKIKEPSKDKGKMEKAKEIPKTVTSDVKVKEAPKPIAKGDKIVEKKTEKEKLRKKRESEEKQADEEGSLFLPGNSFLFVLDSDSVDNTLCQKHSQIYLKQLKKYQIWALMMYDASAKFPSGILQGNANQYGDFDECLAINAVFKNVKDKSKKPSGIKGKYCLATIDVSTDSDSKNLQVAVERAESFRFIKSTIHDPGHFIPRFSTVNWGMCVPSACVAKDVEEFLKSRLENFTNATGLQFDVDVDEDNCVVKEDLKFEFETETTMVILFYFVVLSISLYATLLDKKKKEKVLSEEEKIERELQAYETQGVPAKLSFKEKAKKILMAFSLKKNTGKLLSDTNKGGIECINGIKSIFTVMLYFAHKTIPLGMSPFSNRIFLTKISNQPSTILLRASIIYTDSFLLISGVLTSYNLAKEISEKRKISWVKKSVARFIRLTPALFAVVLFYAFVWDRLGSGPIWNLIIGENASLCRKYMWRNLLYIQNFFAFENMCAPQTHQLALDMQLSLLSPLFVHLMFTYDKAGVGILQAFFILSSIIRYITASNNKLSVVIYHGMPVSQLYETANLLYGQTFHRASPYIMGTIVGYYLNKLEKSFQMHKAFAFIGWILSLVFAFYSVMSASPLAKRTYQYDVQDAAQYAALSPVAWSLALSWFIVACHLGYGGFLNTFLCRKIFLVFSRISYSVYLTQFLVFFYNIGITRIPEFFTFGGSINVTEFLMVIGVSVVLTLLFDIPMMEIKKIILDKPETKVPPKDEVQIEHEEQSKEVSEIGNEGLSREDSQETTEEILEPIGDEGEYEYEREGPEEMEGEEIEGEEQEEGEVEGEEPEEAEIGDGELDEAEVEQDEPEAVEIGEEEPEEADLGEEETEGTEETEEGEEEGELEDENPEEEKEEEVIDAVFEIQPLRRSTRMHFSDESEDSNVFKVEPEADDEDK